LLLPGLTSGACAPKAVIEKYSAPLHSHGGGYVGRKSPSTIFGLSSSIRGHPHRHPGVERKASPSALFASARKGLSARYLGITSADIISLRPKPRGTLSLLDFRPRNCPLF